jgi:signal transduction histidine kinase
MKLSSRRIGFELPKSAGWHSHLALLAGHNANIFFRSATPEVAASFRMLKKKLRRDVDAYEEITRNILLCANRGATRIEFLTRVSSVFLEQWGCDALELWVHDPDIRYRWELERKPEQRSRFTVVGDRSRKHSDASGRAIAVGYLKELRAKIARRFGSGSILYTSKGSLWTASAPVATRLPTSRSPRSARLEPYPSVAIIPFSLDERVAGLLHLKSVRRTFFTRRNVEFYEGIAQVLALTIVNQRAQWALRERVKELTCLYGISRIAQHSEITLDETLQRIVELLPPAWQFPEVACARLRLDGRAFITSGFREGANRQTAELTVNGKLRGCIEVVYLEERPEFAEGPFLNEERSLIDTVGQEVAMIVERRETEAYQATLQAQLRHADRLATIGQLAAGVAHELNEPLGSVLGFAQLIRKDSKLPDGAARDLERIVNAALRAREVIQKLLVFSRQKTPLKTRVNLNRIVKEGLLFLEPRCAAAGIRVLLVLAPGLPEINADASQLHQILVNLVVNSMQAMPEGGLLTIETRADAACVCLSVQDTGIGIGDEIKEKIFTPFFTTKDVDQGTGLGLAVVHGIVTGHGGSIRVESAPDKGAKFEIRLPMPENHA